MSDGVESLPEGRLTLVVLLHVRDGRESEVDAFEADAVRAMARFGGRIERCVRTGGNGQDAPDEVHLVTFPDQASLDAYMRSPEVAAAAERREQIFERTVVWRGEEVT